MKSHSDSEYGYFWGYGTKNNGVDLPQRFGDEAFYYFDWGDTEVRYTWKNLTLGFGTQAIWLGPAQVNAILHSNNAPTYPKFDVGLRRTEIHIPWLNWYIGDIEARIWTGKLTESDYYDSDESNDNNMIHGLALAYAPSFVPGLTLFANRTCLVKWDWENLKYIIPIEANTHVGEQGAGEDQKMSFGADWIFAPVGLEVYGELGLDIRFIHLYTLLDLRKHLLTAKKKRYTASLQWKLTALKCHRTFSFSGRTILDSTTRLHRVTQTADNILQTQQATAETFSIFHIQFCTRKNKADRCKMESRQQLHLQCSS